MKWAAKDSPVLGQALLARAELGALPVSAAGELNLGLAAFGELVESQLAGYFHRAGE